MFLIRFLISYCLRVTCHLLIEPISAARAT